MSSEVEFDPEHNCSKLVCKTRSNGSGIRTVIDRDFLTSPEYRELKRLHGELLGAGHSPFILEEGEQAKAAADGARASELGSHKALLDFVMERGKKGQYIQRYKGFGRDEPVTSSGRPPMDPQSRVLAAGPHRGRRRGRRYLLHAHGRPRGAPPEVHRGLRADGAQPGYLVSCPPFGKPDP